MGIFWQLLCMCFKMSLFVAEGIVLLMAPVVLCASIILRGVIGYKKEFNEISYKAIIKIFALSIAVVILSISIIAKTWAFVKLLLLFGIPLFVIVCLQSISNGIKINDVKSFLSKTISVPVVISEFQECSILFLVLCIVLSFVGNTIIGIKILGVVALIFAITSYKILGKKKDFKVNLTVAGMCNLIISLISWLNFFMLGIITISLF